MNQEERKCRLRRVGIFFYYDAEGKVDAYVDTLLNAVCGGIDRMLVVSNSALDGKARALFHRYARDDDIIVRENRGFDVWAYRTGMEHLGWAEIEQYDELILFNYTIIAVIPDFSGVFAKMDARKDLDFWGLTAHYGTPNQDPYHGPYGYLPVHIQSHFLAFRKSVTSAGSFRRFWNELMPIRSYLDSVSKFESYITKWLADQGFSWDVYADTTPLMEYTPYPLFDLPIYAMQSFHAPIVKRKTFIMGNEHFVLTGNLPLASRKLMDDLRREGRCDTDKIYRNIIRTAPQRDIFETIGMTYLLPARSEEMERDISAAVLIVVGRGWELDLGFFEPLISMYAVFLVADGAWIEQYAKDLPPDTVLTQAGEGTSSASNFFTGSPFDFRDYEFVCVVNTPDRGAAEGDTLEARQTLNMNQLTLTEEVKRLLLMGPAPVAELMRQQPYAALLMLPPRTQELMVDIAELPDLWKRYRKRLGRYLYPFNPAAFEEKITPMYIPDGFFFLRSAAVAGDVKRMDCFHDSVGDLRCFYLFLPLLVQKNGFLPCRVCDEDILMNRCFEYEFGVRQMRELMGIKNEMGQIRNIYLCEKDEVDQIRQIYLHEKDEVDQIRQIYLQEVEELRQIRDAYRRQMDVLAGALRECEEIKNRSLRAFCKKVLNRLKRMLGCIQIWKK